MKLEEYGFIGDLHTAALVGANGSIDWLCLPRFDAQSCLCRLLGSEKDGRWLLGPAMKVLRSSQRYVPDTLILVTRFETETGVVEVTDFMPTGGSRHDLIRIVEGVEGRVAMNMELVLRFDYARTLPWIHPFSDGIRAVAGPNTVFIRADFPLRHDEGIVTGSTEVGAGERRWAEICWYPAHEKIPPAIEPFAAREETAHFWRDWCAQCTYRGGWRDAVMRSLITLKALTYQPTGGMVAAPTTSLPERIGGVRNWDYRFCWLRDATLTLRAMMHSGFTSEATEWGDWLLRAVAGDPGELQMLYGVAGERFLEEKELGNLPGYEASRPVRVGNAAVEQFQLDVYGEIMDAIQLKRRLGLPTSEDAWQVQRRLVEFVIRHWDHADEGIWEVRGPRRQFTHSKMMAWVALDRAIEAVEANGLDGDAEQWRRVRDEIHHTVCSSGYNARRGAFTQYFGSDRLDASLLMIPLVGFLPADDQRVRGTIDAIHRELTRDGLVHRYHPEQSSELDGLPPGEGTFLPCSFWLVDCLGKLERRDEAEKLFERLLSLRTPLGLLSEEYDTHARRLVGNFPQAFSHVALVNAALNLEGAHSRGK